MEGQGLYKFKSVLTIDPVTWINETWQHRQTTQYFHTQIHPIDNMLNPKGTVADRTLHRSNIRSDILKQQLNMGRILFSSIL